MCEQLTELQRAAGSVLCSVTLTVTPLSFLCLCLLVKPCALSLLPLDESDYQTEYEEEVLDNQKDDYLDFISNQAEEDSDSVQTTLEQAGLVTAESGLKGGRWMCWEMLADTSGRERLRRTVQSYFLLVQTLNGTGSPSSGQSLPRVAKPGHG